MPPVARITPTSRVFISSCVPSRLTSVMQERASGGNPAPTAARCRTLTVSSMHFRADGCGDITQAFRDLIEMSALKIAVEVGLVEGMTAATTPIGSAISTTRRARSSRMTPTVFMGRMYS
jgi:hypothetical protein